MGSLESSKRQEVLNFHLILPHPGNLWATPLPQQMLCPQRSGAHFTAALQGCPVLQGGRVAGKK